MTHPTEDVTWRTMTAYWSGTSRVHECYGVRITLCEWAERSHVKIEPLKHREDPKPAIGLGFTIPVSKIPELRAALQIMQDALAQELRKAADAGDLAAEKALHDRLEETE